MHIELFPNNVILASQRIKGVMTKLLKLSKLSKMMTNDKVEDANFEQFHSPLVNFQVWVKKMNYK